MPKYGRLHRYGARMKYGKYTMSFGGGGGSVSLGPYMKFRIRSISSDGTKSEFLMPAEERVSIPSKGAVRTRIRANDGEWCTTQNETIMHEAAKVRIRSISSDAQTTEWVYSDRGNLS